MTGDNVPDLIVGSSTSSLLRGEVALYSGRDGRTVDAWVGPSDLYRFGSVLASGHLDNDRCMDIVIGAAGLTSPGEGAVMIVSGKTKRVCADIWIGGWK